MFITLGPDWYLVRGIIQNIDFVIKYGIQYCSEEIMKLLVVYHTE